MCNCTIRAAFGFMSTCRFLATQEGLGRQDRKLAVAVHKRRAGRSEFVVYPAGIECSAKLEAVLGRVKANLLGSRYSIWDSVSIFIVLYAIACKYSYMDMRSMLLSAVSSTRVCARC